MIRISFAATENGTRTNQPWWSGLLLVCVATVALWSIPNRLFAQQPPSTDDRRIVKLGGKLQGFANGVLLVERDDGQTVQVALPTDPRYVVFQATALPSGLPGGCVVRLTAELDEKGRVLGVPQEMVVFTPTPPTNFDPNNQESVAAAQQNSIGIYQKGPAQPTIKGKGAGRGPKSIGSFLVVGRVSRATKRELVLDAAGALVSVPITNETTVPVSLVGSLELAKQGDMVQFSGFCLPADDKQVWAEAVTITASRTLGETPEKPARAQRGAKRGSSADHKNGGQPPSDATTDNPPSEATGKP